MAEPDKTEGQAQAALRYRRLFDSNIVGVIVAGGVGIGGSRSGFLNPEVGYSPDDTGEAAMETRGVKLASR